MTDGFVDPQEVADPTEAATGEAGPDEFDMEHPPAEPAEPDTPWWIRGLRSTDPNPPVETVSDLADIRDHWKEYGIRGIQKVGSVDDAEAWVDLVRFALGAVLERAEAGDDDAEPSDGGGELPDGL